MQAIQAIHCFHLIAPIALEVGGTGHVLDPSLILPDQIKHGSEKSNSKDRDFLSIAVDDIAAQKNKGSPKCTEAQILGARNVSEKTTVRCFSYAGSRTSAP